VRIFKPGRNPFRRYPGTIYRIRTAVRPFGSYRPGRNVTGYVGKTRKRPYTKRIAEHRVTQPWSDLIVSHDVLWESRRVTVFGLWWREIYYILTRFPVYNVQWNRIRWNPRRIPPYVAVTQRGERDGLRHYRTGEMRTRS
jgi:hypothetical protein